MNLHEDLMEIPTKHSPVGFPFFVRITHYVAEIPSNFYHPRDDAELEYEITDRNGRVADFIVNKMSSAMFQQLDDYVLEQLEREA